MLRNYFIRKAVACTLIFAAIVIFNSCLDHKDDGYTIQPAGVAFINASPGSSDLALIADGQYEYLSTKFSYDSSVGYFTAFPGYRVFGFAKNDWRNLIVSQQFYLEPLKAYSIFIADTAANAKMFCFSDSLKIADSSVKAFVRFINMSPNSKGLDLKTNGTTMFSNIAYGKGTEFTEVTPKDNESFTINENGTTVVLGTISDMNLKKGGIYTLWTRGYENSKIDSLKIGLKQVQNNESAKKENKSFQKF